MHLVGSGDSQRDIESPVWVNPQMDSYWHPILKIQKHFYMNGSCADTIGNNGSNIDKSVVQKKLELVREMLAGFKLMLFAFEWFHDELDNAYLKNQFLIFQMLTLTKWLKVSRKLLIGCAGFTPTVQMR